MKSMKISDLILNLNSQQENKLFEVKIDNNSYSCVWNKVKSVENQIGYWFQLISPAIDISPGSSPLPLKQFDCLTPDNFTKRTDEYKFDDFERFHKVQFVYHFGKNQFYMDNSGAQAEKLAYNSFVRLNTERDNAQLTSNQSLKISQMKPTTETLDKGNGRGFYKQIIDRIEKIIQGDTANYLYQKCLHATDYSCDINTYRMDKDGTFRPVKSHDIPMLRAEDFDDESQGIIKKGNRKNPDGNNGKILVNAIKSKSHLYKTILNMPLPKVFNGLIYVTLLVMCVCFGMVIAENFVLDNVLTNIFRSIDSTHTQLGLISTAMEMSTWILQASSVGQYFFK